MCSYNENQVSPYDPTKLAIHSILRPEDDLTSNCGQKSEKSVSFVDNVHFIDEEVTVTYEDFARGITFYPETPKKIDRPTENGSTFPDPVKNLSALPITISLAALLIISIFLLSF